MRRPAVVIVAASVLLALSPTASASTSERSSPEQGGSRVLTPGDRAPASAAERVARALDRRPDVVRYALRVDSRDHLPAVAAAARARGVEVARTSTRLRAVVVEVPRAQASQRARELAGLRGVGQVQEVGFSRPAFVPSDPRYATQQKTHFATLNAEPAWDGASGEGVTVAVVDSGAAVGHPELAGKVDGTYDAYSGGTDVTDVAGHGTAVASVIAANTGGVGMAGAARSARLLAAKVEDPDGIMWNDLVAEGIGWAVDQGADVINLSLGGPSADSFTESEVARARAAGIVVVASAGNDPVTALNYPAAFPGVISVGATVPDGSARTDFSTYGDWVDIAAPGQDVLVALPTSVDNEDGAVDGYDRWDGTSFSGPLVAAGAALVRGAAPLLTGQQVEDVVLGSHDGKSLGFARGNADYAAAVRTALGLQAPSLTSPEAGATVGGAVPVSATSSASSVRFSWSGSPMSVTAPVVDGVASAELPSWGLSGAQSVVARSCSTGLCSADEAVRQVTVQNAAPVVTSPVGGTQVSVSFPAAADADGGGVAFRLDGVRKGFDAAAPYSAAVSTQGLPDGNHELTAVLCNVAGTVCDTAGASSPVTVAVKQLRPTVSVSTPAISPNGDGRLDAVVATYKLEQTQTVDLRVRNASGVVVRSLRHATNRATGTYGWTWDGRNNSGAVVADGAYTLAVETSRSTTTGTIRGYAAQAVRVDRARPALTKLVASPTTFHPYVDQYLDTTKLGVTTNEALSRLEARVTNSSGQLVRSIVVGAQAAGARSVVWNGKKADGALAPAGVYGFTLTATDVAGNVTTSAKGSVTVTANRYAKRTTTSTVLPHVSGTEHYIGACSAIFYDVRTWTGSYGYYSDYECASSPGSGDDLAAAVHSFQLPSAARYETVRIAAYGGAADQYPDTAALVYLDPLGEATDHGIDLGAALGTYTGPTVPAGSVADGRWVRWLAGTTDYNWYDVKHFLVTSTYWVRL